MHPLIALEEHFFSQEMLRTPAKNYNEQMKHIPGLIDKLTDLGQIRLEHMDKGGVSLQVISHAPGPLNPEQAAKANDQLAEAISKNKTRFAGFAVLSLMDPSAAAKELTRCVKELGFVGALIDNHTHGKYYDGKEFWPFWETVQALDVAIYIHPSWPADDIAPRLQGNFTNAAAVSMGSSGFGWHADVHLHVLRLFASGLFDAYPKLKIIIGHFGEMLPFQLERVEQLSVRWGDIKRKIGQVYDENIWITTSGVWSVNPMACILRNTKIDHILYSVDYPFAKNEDGLKFMQDLEKSGLVTDEQLAMIAYKNSEALLKVKVAQ